MRIFKLKFNEEKAIYRGSHKFIFKQPHSMQAINITAFTKDSSQIEAIKSVLHALKIKFEVGTYNPEFVAKIKKSKQEAEEGKVTRVKKEDLQKFLGL